MESELVQILLVGRESAYGKQVIVAETAYPFRLDSEDFLGNIIYPATPAGQATWLRDPASGNGWENQALFGYDDRLLPAADEFRSG